jgi:single-stranded-DNA-specific exonuclease
MLLLLAQNRFSEILASQTDAGENRNMSGRTIKKRTAAASDEALDGIHPLLARIYLARGITKTEELCLDLKEMIPIGHLQGAVVAVDLLIKHLESEGKILVVGDFDADGATSSALVVRALRGMGFTAVDFLVPNRFEFGYGLSPELADVAAERKPSLIVTVDNGISSEKGVAVARQHGIDVLITDHHLPPDQLPAAQAIVNPNLADESFPGKNLAGVGVAFYLMAALAQKLLSANETRILLGGLLDLVALGTVADVVPLDKNNRILVEQGLRRIRSGSCAAGITALLKDGRREPSRTVSSDLGFVVGPRLNAAGRLDDMTIGIRCLLTDDPTEATELATILGDLNRERREIEAKMQARAQEAVASVVLAGEGVLPSVLCLFEDNWHPGVVGLVASRIKEEVHRPVVAFAREGDRFVKGSARSIPGLHIRDALAEVNSIRPGLIDKFGGHAMAAGLTIGKDHLGEFRRLLTEVADRHLDEDALNKVLLTDGHLNSEEFSLDTAEMLRNGGPWGQSFPEPLFEGYFSVCSTKIMKEKHLKLRVRPAGDVKELEAVAFNQADVFGTEVPSEVRLVYRAEINHFRGFANLQLIVEHMESCEAGSAN